MILMESIFFVVISIGFIGFLLAFISKRKHLLATLLSLEGLMLLLIIIFYLLGSITLNLYSFVLIFLTLAACEGALGLSLLVCMVRNYGGDQFNSFNFLQC